MLVVICFQISIFEPLGTIITVMEIIDYKLWFAFKLVSLNHWEQCCPRRPVPRHVVICFQISIFEPLGTIKCILKKMNKPLWFAFKLVSLNHWEQSATCLSRSAFVVICFQISIFEPLGTILPDSFNSRFSCDLLSN